ncbi:unnamed protein product [Caenorhabditis brenneri]
MPSSSSSSSMNVFELLMERDLSKKSMINGPTFKVNSGSKKASKPVPPTPIITPLLSKGYSIPKKKGSGPTSGAQKLSKPATIVPATAGSLKSIVVKKPAKINEKMLQKMIVKSD